MPFFKLGLEKKELSFFRIQIGEIMRYSNRLFNELNSDPISENYCRQVQGAHISSVLPTPVSKPKILTFSVKMAEQLGFNEKESSSPEFAQVMGGNAIFQGMETYAHCYGGHQFGNWAGQLGDGRAIALGEIEHQGKFWELQLKGAGETPYSRRGDGRAVLRSSIREFLCSEAMAALGIPTTRALSLVGTGDGVLRDMMYDGNAQIEQGAIVCRVAESFLRFGSFEIFYARDDDENLQRLLDFTLKNYYPQFHEKGKEGYVSFFHEVCRRTAKMIAGWMGVGFVHGVMNTDNMSILGLTIDYGPYGWLDIYDENWTPNTSDGGLRYSYGNQPHIGAWNMTRLGQALYSVIGDVKPLQDGLKLYREIFESEYTWIRMQKLGFSPELNQNKADCINELYSLMESTETDPTILFRKLSDISISKEQPETDQALCQQISDAFYQYSTWKPQIFRDWGAWMRSYIQVLRTEGKDEQRRQAEMKAVNPKFIFRNYLAQLAIDQTTEGDLSFLHNLQKVLESPFEEHPEHEEWAKRMPDWARSKVGCSMLSCSS